METISLQQPKLLDELRNVIRLKGYSRSTEAIYHYWCKQYILFHKKRHPNQMGHREIQEYLTHLAVSKKVSPSAQNQAISALLFLYERVLQTPIKEKLIRSKQNRTTIFGPVCPWTRLSDCSTTCREYHG
jgi:hypothetical protein